MTNVTIIYRILEGLCSGRVGDGGDLCADLCNQAQVVGREEQQRALLVKELVTAEHSQDALDALLIDQHIHLPPCQAGHSLGAASPSLELDIEKITNATEIKE